MTKAQGRRVKSENGAIQMRDLEQAARERRIAEAAHEAAQVLYGLAISGKLSQVSPEFFIDQAIKRKLNKTASETEISKIDALTVDYLQQSLEETDVVPSDFVTIVRNRQR
jgi:Zn-dependent M32 family carboxypeptidase